MRPETTITNFDKDKLQEIVSRSNAVSQVLDEVGSHSNASRRAFWRRVEKGDIDASHIAKGLGANSHATNPAKSLAEVLVKNSDYKRGDLKRRLLKEGLLKNMCYECGQPPEWMGKPLVMILDHRNGMNNDNRLENLRMVCPDCDTQLDTFTGRNWVHPKKPSSDKLAEQLATSPIVELAKEYGVSRATIVRWAKSYGLQTPARGKWSRIGSESKRRKSAMDRREKKFSMSKENLAKLLWEKPTEVIAKEHGVSGNCIAKHAKKHGLSKPPRGYGSGRRSPSENLDS